MFPEIVGIFMYFLIDVHDFTVDAPSALLRGIDERGHALRHDDR
jgi:hypothetical protein